MAAYELTVTVRTQYLEDQSDPDRSRFVFAYAVTIKNTGNVPAQVISRHWVITDANDHVEQVRGLGVVGHQPRPFQGRRHRRRPSRRRRRRWQQLVRCAARCSPSTCGLHAKLNTPAALRSPRRRVRCVANIFASPKMVSNLKPRFLSSCCHCRGRCIDAALIKFDRDRPGDPRTWSTRQ